MKQTGKRALRWNSGRQRHSSDWEMRIIQRQSQIIIFDSPLKQAWTMCPGVSSTLTDLSLITKKGIPQSFTFCNLAATIHHLSALSGDWREADEHDINLWLGKIKTLKALDYEVYIRWKTIQFHQQWQTKLIQNSLILVLIDYCFFELFTFLLKVRGDNRFSRYGGLSNQLA